MYFKKHTISLCREILGEFDEPLEDDLIEMSIQMGDLDCDGSINYEEVLKVINDNECHIESGFFLTEHSITENEPDLTQTEPVDDTKNPKASEVSEEASLLTEKPTSDAVKSKRKKKKKKKSKQDT